MTKDNLISKALEYAREHPKGFTQSELEKYLGVESSKWGPLSNQFGQGEKFLFNQFDHSGKEELFNLSKEGILTLAQLDAANSAHLSAKAANFAKWVAVFSALVALVALILGPLLSSRLVTNIKLDEEQFNELQTQIAD